MTETPSDRPAVRVICVDSGGRVLLLHWHDPVSGRVFWEPPGGGIDPGETPLDAARRELREETGLPGEAIRDVCVRVDRDFHWLGRHYVKVEPFYLARFGGSPAVRPGGFTPEENETYLGHAWLTHEEITALPNIDPPHLLTAVAPLLAADG
ncbi:NUDIX domain-containing protein [Actinomadura sp. NPDC047616]|uniref:NUDIX hydrolase n=1 Tax=Actinomadura sp. NPDC047616 TaxID=3155914 RepID=UPI0033D4D76D